ncbi:MAG: TIGR02281 family clan AA aspartic protease [Rhodospirillales bacterium]|nr:TIGR02281 family clan AA aspartic protease [Rhodospirillales bacterium]
MRMKMNEALRNIGAWLGIAAVIFLGYSYRGELEGVKNRVLGELVPSQGATLDEASISFRESRNGHYQIKAEVNGQWVDFMLDTGATSIVLSPQDAERLGYGAESLAFTGRANTANGVIRTAKVTLRRLAVGPIAFDDVPAIVNGAPMSKSLLGMSFLKRLRTYSVNNGTLILRK